MEKLLIILKIFSFLYSLALILAILVCVLQVYLSLVISKFTFISLFFPCTFLIVSVCLSIYIKFASAYINLLIAVYGYLYTLYTFSI